MAVSSATRPPRGSPRPSTAAWRGFAVALLGVVASACGGGGSDAPRPTAGAPARGGDAAPAARTAPRGVRRWRAFVALERQAAVAVFDGGARRRVVRRTRVPAGPHNLAASRDGRRVAVSSPPAGRVTLLDSAGRTVASAAIAGGPHDVKFTPDSRTLWVTAERGRQIVELDARSGRRLRARATGGAPHDLAVSPDGRRLWVTIDGSAAVDVRSATDGRLLGRPRLGGAPHDVAFDPGGRRVWLSNFQSPLLTVASARTARRLGSLRAGSEPHHFAFGLGRLWASDNGGGSLVSLDPARRAVSRRVRVGSAPHHVAIAGSEVLVAVNGAGRVAVVSRAGRVRAHVPVGAGPHGIAAIRLPPSPRGARR